MTWSWFFGLSSLITQYYMFNANCWCRRAAKHKIRPFRSLWHSNIVHGKKKNSHSLLKKRGNSTANTFQEYFSFNENRKRRTFVKTADQHHRPLRDRKWLANTSSILKCNCYWFLPFSSGWKDKMETLSGRFSLSPLYWPINQATRINFVVH